MVMPGDNVSVEVELIAPVAMEKGQRFAIREGGRTIGAGRVIGSHRLIAFETSGARSEYSAPPF